MEPLKNPELEELRRKWQSPETTATLQRHMEQYYRAGVIDSYLACADASYPPSYGSYYVKLQEQISRIVRAEVYLVATTEVNGAYYLERVNEETGFSTTTTYDNGLVQTMLSVVTSWQNERNLTPPFTETQAQLVEKHAHELQGLGLRRPLWPSDLRITSSLGYYSRK